MTAPAFAVALPPALAPLARMLSGRWHGLALRERRLVAAAAASLLLLAVWALGVAPALRTLREAPIQIERLDAELLRMRSQASEAATLRDAVPVTPAQAIDALTAATERLGNSAKLVVQGDRATLQLSAIDATALQAWLAQARSAARARPVEMQLTHGAQGLAGSLVVSFGVGG